MSSTQKCLYYLVALERCTVKVDSVQTFILNLTGSSEASKRWEKSPAPKITRSLDMAARKHGRYRVVHNSARAILHNHIRHMYTHFI